MRLSVIPLMAGHPRRAVLVSRREPPRRPAMKISAAWLVTLMTMIVAPGIAAAQSDDESDSQEAAGIVATQVRDQGYACDDPVSAKAEQGEDGDNVWRLDCQNASYRVRLVPDMAASIERID